jgi:hypothetical protein
MKVKKARSVSMRSAQAALLLTTALAWGMSAQTVSNLRGMRGAHSGSSLTQPVQPVATGLAGKRH